MNSIKIFVILVIVEVSLLAQTVSYLKNTIHAFLPKKGEVSIGLGMEMINSTIDVLKIKEQELGGSGQDLSSIGDMDSIYLDTSYTFTDDFYLHADYNRKYLQYAGSTLINNNIDLYLRYQVYRDDSFAFAVDGGLVVNIAEDIKIYDIDTINSSIGKVASGKDIKISQDGKEISYTDSSGTKTTASLSIKPYLALLDTYDQSLYYRLVASFKSENILFDLFGGYKQIKVNYAIDSSLAHEEALVNEVGDKASVTQDRADGMLFVGAGLRYNIGSWYGEANYKYNKMLRIEGLGEIDYNHVFDLNLIYSFNTNFSVYIGGKLMTRQFNGEIPYLYTQYSQTTFDHPYGYLNMGTTIKF